jgi:hypothetical protein
LEDIDETIKPASIRSIAFSPDGNLLCLAVSDDGYIFMLGTKPPGVPGKS